MTDNIMILALVGGFGCILLCLTLFWMKLADIRSRNQYYCEQIYSELLNALTMVVVTGDEEHQLKSNLALAQIVNKVNLIAGAGVLSYMNAFLELQNTSGADAKKNAKQHAILNALVFAIRKETRRQPSERTIRRLGCAFKFYMPARNHEKGRNQTEDL